MKSIFNKTLVGAFALLPLFTACQSEPEVGSPLYPVEEEDFGPKVYFYDTAGSTSQTSTVVKTPSGLVIPDDTIKMYAQITQTVNQDVTVKLVEDAEVTETEDMDVLPTGTIKFVEGSVVIKAGATRSETPLKAVLQECESIANMEDIAIAGMKLTTDATGVSVSKDYSTFLWKVQKKELNVKEGTMDGKTVIDPSEYNISSSIGYPSRLIDDNFTTNWTGYFEAGEDYIIVGLNEEVNVTSVVIYPGNYYDYTWDYSLNHVEILTSSDGNKWKSHGEIQFVPANDYIPNVIEFYTPVKTKFVKINPINTVEGYYQYAVTSELRITK